MVYPVRYSKAQLKIQQMAFVLVAILIFFVLVGLFYFSFRFNALKRDAGDLETEKARELVRRISGIPELRWKLDCDSCIDLDKAIVLKDKAAYNGFFGLSFLAIEAIYPKKPNKECTKANYPDCNIITIVNGTDFGTARRTFVSLCRWDQDISTEKCELGVIYAARKTIK